MGRASPQSASPSKGRRPSSQPRCAAVTALMEHQEIARRLRLTIDQVKVAQESGLRKLRLLLESRGVTRLMVMAAFNPDSRRYAAPRAHPDDGAARLLRFLFISDGLPNDDGDGSS